jgi:hypothetical protein
MATEFPHAVKVAPHRNVKWVILGIFLRIPAAEAHRHKYGVRKLVAGKFRNLCARRERVTRVLAEVYGRLAGDIDDHDLERYHLGMVKHEAELAALEEHLLRCSPCIDRIETTARYVDAFRAAACSSSE